MLFSTQNSIKDAFHGDDARLNFWYDYFIIINACISS